MALPPLPSGPRTRLAPTPSGLLHIGNGASFVLTWRLARAARGTVLLRIDDLDAERARMDHVADIFETLEWLGIDWDEGPTGPDDLAREWSQHHRIARYQERVEALRGKGALYACSCSRAQVGRCTCRDRRLPFDQAEVTWRLDLRSAPKLEFRCWPGTGSSLAPHALMPVDPVIRQRNDRPAYQIASLADDLDHHIDLIVRGEDLLPSTACQLHMASLLGEQAFCNALFVHHGLLKGQDGSKLSKSQGAASLRAMRLAGEGPGMVHRQADALFEALVRAQA